jgi:hypothetical protein
MRRYTGSAYDKTIRCWLWAAIAIVVVYPAYIVHAGVVAR